MEPIVAPIPRARRARAPYGRACLTCARTKAKCVTENGTGDKCQRCLRLNQDCQPVQPIRKRKTVRTADLEKKLDGLYELLQASTATSIAGQTAHVPIAHASTQPSPESFQTPVLNPEDDASDPAPHVIQRLNWNRPSIGGLRLQSPTTAPDTSYVASGTRSTTSHCPQGLSNGCPEPSPDEAEEFLNIFRAHMTAYFPFIIVPESTTAYELRRACPFLWLCIMSIASKSTIQQKALAKEMKITIGREIFVEGKNNLDLLLGLLVFVAWGHYHIYDGPILIQTAQLAMALVGNLGLNKPPPKEPTQTMLNLDARGCPTKPFSPSIRTMEERRAVLCYFFLSSVLSSYFQRLDAFRWTPYLEECVAVLAEKKERPTDAFLTQSVRLQLIEEKVGQAPWHEERSDATSSVRAPPAFYLKALQAELQDVKANIPPDVERNDCLLLHFYSTELTVNEIALSKAAIIFNSPGFERLHSLYACLDATKSWFDLFLAAFSPSSFIGLSISIFTQMAHCIIGLYRLLTLDDPTWDRKLARSTANLSLILGRIIQNLNQVKVAADLDHGASEAKDIFSGTARTLGTIKTWWEAKLAAELTDNMVSDETLGELNMESFDDVWLENILSPGDGLFDLNM